MNDVNIVIGGEAGQGLVTVGDFLTRGLIRAGYEVLVTQDYMSRIRGGHNTYAVRVSPDPIHGPAEEIDVLVALDEASLKLHRDELSAKAVVLADEKFDHLGLPGLRIPFKELRPKPIFDNVAALGALCSLLCLEKTWLTGIIEQVFHKKGEEMVRQNLEVFEKARAWTESQEVGFTCAARPKVREKRIMLNGNQAIALGGMAAGVNFCSFYPMTPSTSIALTLIDKGRELGVFVEQAEDEIAAVNMALGASFAGARVMVPTSGGGFALMVEGISLAGMTETPLTVTLAMRPGPATGLPTRTEQGDLNLVLYAGHGEFPRAIFAPGSVEQCFELCRRAVDTAEKYQTPVFVLTDQYLADSFRSVKPFEADKPEPAAGPLQDWPDDSPYRRYEPSQSGVSPRLIPGLSKKLVGADGDEHTPDGHITEDLQVRIQMQDKRMRKMTGMMQDAVKPDFYGAGNPDLLLVCWGSTLGPALEAAQSLNERGEKAGLLHFSQPYPLVPAHFMERLEKAGRVVMVEGNSTGQFARLVRSETGFEFKRLILRYDGLPFTAGYILSRLDGAS